MSSRDTQSLRITKGMVATARAFQDFQKLEKIMTQVAPPFSVVRTQSCIEEAETKKSLPCALDESISSNAHMY
jgi:hypothetical protein